jgi:hypothetical protein
MYLKFSVNYYTIILTERFFGIAVGLSLLTIDCSGVGALMGRESTKSRTSTFEKVLDLALNGYMLTETKLVCLAMQQFGAFILVLHTGDINSVETSILALIMSI